jgi:predicted O-linked N-acetylglucosamine transferase (SPINDLY family)
VGYVTGQFISVPTFYFLEPVLQTHDRSQFEIFCYHTRPMYDPATRQYQQIADRWRDAQKWSDDELESAIRCDRIDVLVDLSGHYPHGRLNLMARRPAPVQVVFPNYPSTTGVAAFDALITDEWTTPTHSGQFYAEPVRRLKSGYLTYKPPEVAPEPGPLPARRNGFITFGIFQRPSKYNAAFWDMTAAVLAGVAESRLMVHFGCADLRQEDSVTRQLIQTELQKRAIDPSRMVFRSGARLADHLRVVSECDIALDTFPYNGQTTTCECLWMGVPVVAPAGDSHVSRVSYALLARLGLADWVASPDELAALAVRKAGSLEELEHFRMNIRSRMLASSLCNPEQATRDLEEAYRDLWCAWCRSAGTGTFEANGEERVSAPL